MKRNLLLLIIALFAFGLQINAQTTLTLTISGGYYAGEKWVDITTGPDGTGTVLWAQGDGTYGNGAGLLTNEPFTIIDGTTYYINCYDKYDDGWDGTIYEVKSPSGTVIANNMGTSPNDGNDEDSTSSWEDMDTERESSESFSYTPPACENPASTISNILDISADATWSAAAGATNYDWEVQPSGTPQGTPGAVASGNTAALMVSITGLMPVTDYDFYIKSDCMATWSSATAFSTVATPPVNDICSGAIPITPSAEGTGCGSATFTLPFDTDGTTDSGTDGTCNNTNTGKDQFFTWTATTTGLAFDSQSPGDPGIIVWDACGGTEIDCIQTLTDGNLSGWDVGDNLIIQIYDYGTSSSAVAFCLEEYVVPNPPANDECANATVIDCNTNLMGETTVAATDNGDDVGCTQGIGVWYKFVGNDMDVTLEVVPTYDIKIGIATSTDCATFTNVLCKDASTTTETATFFAAMGSDYFIYIGHYSNTSSVTGNFDIAITSCVVPPNPPANDLCAGALVAPVGAGSCGTTTTGDNSGATDSGVTTPTCGSSSYSGGDIWYSITVPMGETVINYERIASAFSTTYYALYSGDCASLTEVDCGSGATDEFTGLVGGDTYYFRLWDWGSDDYGVVEFCLFTPPSCLPPTTLTETNITLTSADLGWVPNNMESGWNVEVGPVGFTPGSGTAEFQENGTGSNPLTVTGLTESTSYDWYVQADCGDMDFSPWSAKGEFTTLAPPPANDDMCNAVDITLDAAPTTGTNTAATGETGEPNGSCWNSTATQESVWYTFTAPATGNVTVSTDFDTPLADTHIAIYDAPTACADMTTLGAEVGCDEDAGNAGDYGWNSIAVITGLTAGDTYYVQVDGYGGSDGEFMIEVKEDPATPPNDDCTAPIQIGTNGTTGEVIDQTTAAATPTTSLGGLCGDGTAAPNDVWYNVVTDSDGGVLTVTVTPNPGSDALYAIGIYSNACPTPTLVSTECLMGTAGNPSSATFNSAAFTGHQTSSTREATYRVRVYEVTNTGDQFKVATTGTALPVTFSAVSAESKENANLIKWSTSSEINSDFMIVERSSDGATDWTTIGKEKGHQFSSVLQNYELLDVDPIMKSYYRINALDKDGKSSYSTIVYVDRTSLDTRKGLLKVYPIPTSEKVVFTLNTLTEDEVIINITSISGKQVMTINRNLDKGIQDLEVDISSLSDGVYFASIISNSVIETIRIVKQ